MIETKVDVAGNLAVHSCHGAMGIREIKSWIRDSAVSETTSHSIWNFSGADLSGITSEEVIELTRFAPVGGRHTGKQKTAVVVSDDLAWGLARVYQIASETNGQRCEVALFRKHADAENWICEEI